MKIFCISFAVFMLLFSFIYSDSSTLEQNYFDEYLQSCSQETRNPLFSLASENPTLFKRIVDEDIKKTYNACLSINSIVEYLDYPGNLFNKAKDSNILLTAAEKKQLFMKYSTFYSSVRTLHLIANKYERDFADQFFKDKEKYFEAYFLGTVAKTVEMAAIAQLISATENSQKIETLFNEYNKTYNIPESSYNELNKWLCSKFSLARIWYFNKYQNNYLRTYSKNNTKNNWLVQQYEYYTPVFQDAYALVSSEISWFNSVLAHDSVTALKEKLYPVMKKISTWIGDMRVKRKNDNLISRPQLITMLEQLKPGDVMVERRDWFLSNIFITGFWPHAILYVGSQNDLNTYFNNDPDTKKFFNHLGYSGIVDYLKENYPEAFNKYFNHKAHDGYIHRVLEAISDGVVCSSIEEAAIADHIGVMRPRLSKLDKAKAIIDGFSFVGREYDFWFDFNSDSTLVCTEFVCKAYADGQEKKGLRFKPEKIAGKPVVKANRMVETFAREMKSQNQQLDFVYFLKGIETKKCAVKATLKDFADSYKIKSGLAAKVSE